MKKSIGWVIVSDNEPVRQYHQKNWYDKKRTKVPLKVYATEAVANRYSGGSGAKEAFIEVEDNIDIEDQIFDTIGN